LRVGSCVVSIGFAQIETARELPQGRPSLQ
jgi:hypothetical protein